MESKVKEWIEVASKLSSLKLVEKELRQEIADHILKDKIKGAKKGVIGPYILTATAKLNTKVDRDLLKTIWLDLDLVEKAAIRFEPKVIAAKYKVVPENSILNQALINKPGMPGLGLKGVK